MYAKQPPPVSDNQISEFWVVPHCRFDYMWQLEILVTAVHASISVMIKCSILKFLYYLVQIKKLVYLYLVRYAEEQQDLALLSISTFQKGLKVSYSFLMSLD